MNEQDKNNNKLIDDFRKFAEQIRVLQNQAATIYAPEVEHIIQCKCIDNRKIENLLDWMLGFAGDKKILALYRKLCRYYFHINPQATAEYIKYYKEMYDEDETLFKSGYFKSNPIE